MAEPLMDGEIIAGDFSRQESHFRDWVGEETDFAPSAGRYHLYISLACPWCHRSAILRELAGLQDAVPVSYLAPFRDERGWAFTGESFTVGPPLSPDAWSGEYVDELHGWAFMSEAYRLSDPDYKGRITVPVLWDTETGRTVNNESSDIIRMFYSPHSLGALGVSGGLDLYPRPQREEIDEINDRVYATVNNGVYRAGFARLQGAYDRAFAALFESFDWLEELLGRRRYLAGERITEADWRLFPTLARFDEVYNLHFRCNRRRLVDYPNLWGYARELHQQPGVSRTVAMDQIKEHYYTTHDELNPKRIIPGGPGYDWSVPHGRS